LIWINFSASTKEFSSNQYLTIIVVTTVLILLLLIMLACKRKLSQKVKTFVRSCQTNDKSSEAKDKESIESDSFVSTKSESECYLIFLCLMCLRSYKKHTVLIRNIVLYR